MAMAMENPHKSVNVGKSVMHYVLIWSSAIECQKMYSISISESLKKKLAACVNR